MQALATIRRFRNLVMIVPVLALTACGQGDGPDSIVNEPVTPLPPVAPGFCDPINFEIECPDPAIVNFNGGATIIVDNPDKNGINTSDLVARMQKFPDEVFGGTLLELAEAVDFSEGEFYTMKVWSPRPVPVSFKLEEQGNPAGGFTVVENHSGSGTWEELCFDVTAQAVPTPVLALTIIFDNGVLGEADTNPDDWTFYYDDITQVESCAVGGGGADIQPDAALYSSSGDPDLVIPDDYSERTPFGSGSIIDPFYADDGTFSPVLSVFSGTDYGANVAQVGFVGFPAGFLTDYDSVNFKVKGMPAFVIIVKLFDGVDALRLNLTSSTYSEELADGWFQVSIPVADFAGAGEATGIVFESDDSSAMQFRMLLTDIGFSGAGDRVPADPGIIPEVSLYDRDGTPDLVIPDDFSEISVFSSGTVIDDDFSDDRDFSPVLAITTGFGYDAWVAQLAYTGFDPGFASAYETLNFKVKDLVGDVIRVKLLPDPDYVDINVTSSDYSTELGNGWYQVSVPIPDLPGAGAEDGLLFETISPAPAESFTFLLTDIGFSGTAGGGTGGGGTGGGGDGGPEGNIVQNGGFETGTFEGWEQLEGGGTQVIVTDNPSSGTYAANLTVPVRSQTDAAVDNLLKNSNLEAGNLTPGAAVTVSFDMRGTLSGAGGVVFAELFSELTGGGTSNSQILGGGPLAPNADWTTYSFGATLGPDVSGGVTLQLKASCGPVEGCGVDVFIDNVSIVLGGSGGGTGGGDTGGGDSGGGGGGTVGEGGTCTADIGSGGTGSAVDSGIAVNGGFETGTFDGWEQLPGGGIQTIVTDNPSSGTYAANLNVPVRGQTDAGVDNLLKNANLEAGNLTPGSAVTVSFDMRGGLCGAGGVVFAEFFSELTGGGTSKAEIFTGGPLVPTTDWATYTFNTTLGSDVSGGATLQLKASCGPVEGCGVDAYFDNVSIVIN